VLLNTLKEKKEKCHFSLDGRLLVSHYIVELVGCKRLHTQDIPMPL